MAYRRHPPPVPIKDDSNPLPITDYTPVMQISDILKSDNSISASKIQSFEREFDKTWERVAVDDTGAIAKLPPLFSSMKIKLENTKKRKEQIDAIIFAAANSTPNPQNNPSEPNPPHEVPKNQSGEIPSENSLSSQTLSENPPLQTNILSNKHGVIRSMCLVVDLTESSLEKDIRPTRFDFLTKISSSFIETYIDQHPLSEISSLTIAQGHCKLRTGVRQPKSDYVEHLKKCQDKSEQKGGVFSLQNTIHSCGLLLQSAPPQSCREIVILTCSLNTVDLKDIEDTIKYCQDNNITVNIVGLDARVRVFERITSITGGNYTIACDSTQFYNGLFAHIKAPIKQQKHSKRGWIQIGFPSVKSATFHNRIGNTGGQQNNSQNNQPTFISTLMCLCHNKLRDRVYICSTCNAAVCQIPNQCPICKTLLLSYPLLAKSAAQLHLPAPTVAVHFSDRLLSLRDTDGILINDDVDAVLKKRLRGKLRFNRDRGEKGERGEKAAEKTQKGNGEVQFIDDGPKITKDDDELLVELESMTFSKSLNLNQIVNSIQKHQIESKSSTQSLPPLLPTTPPLTTMSDSPPITETTSTALTPHSPPLEQPHSYHEHYAVQSSTCQSHIVHCQGCTTPMIVPTTKLLEKALVFADKITNLRICSCLVCQNTDLVTSCSVCGCFLCPDCDVLTQTTLQNCPGCYS